MTDWQVWHTEYDDPTSPLVRRLKLVQHHIGRWLDAHPNRLVHVTSICAGQGRDLIEVLQTRPDAERVTATLVDSDAASVERARAAASAIGLSGLTIRCADAGVAATYRDVPPADLLLVCGVFGNISDPDIAGFIARAAELCAPDASLVWTRTRRQPDITPQVRAWFSAAGFVEEAFEAPAEDLFSVGVHRLLSPVDAVATSERLFTFVR